MQFKGEGKQMADLFRNRDFFSPFSADRISVTNFEVTIAKLQCTTNLAENFMA